jgi:hypothetical protein
VTFCSPNNCVNNNRKKKQTSTQESAFVSHKQAHKTANVVPTTDATHAPSHARSTPNWSMIVETKYVRCCYLTLFFFTRCLFRCRRRRKYAKVINNLHFVADRKTKVAKFENKSRPASRATRAASVGRQSRLISFR